MFRATHATESSLGLLLVGGDESVIEVLESSVLIEEQEDSRRIRFALCRCVSSVSLE